MDLILFMLLMLQSLHNLLVDSILNNNSQKATYGFIVDQLQQLTRALSHIIPNHTICNENAYANAASLQCY